jgi:hypothetical protein
MPKWAGLTWVKNKHDECVPTRIQSRWRAWIDYRKLHAATRKDYFQRPFIDSMVEYLARHEYLRQLCWRILVTRSDCCLLWEVWLKTENLALVGGNPHSFTYHLILFVCFVFVVSFRSSVCHSSLGECSSTVHPTCISHSVLYFWAHWGQCVISVWGWGKHFCLLFLLFLLLLFLLFLLCKIKIKIIIATLLIEHDYIATVVCISLVGLTSWTLHVIKNLNLLTHLLD